MNCDLLLVHTRVWSVHDPRVECSWMCSLWKAYRFIIANNEHRCGVLIYAFVSRAVIHLRVPGFDSVQRQESLCITVPRTAVGRSISGLLQSKARCSQAQGQLYVPYVWLQYWHWAAALSVRVLIYCFVKNCIAFWKTAVFSVTIYPV